MYVSLRLSVDRYTILYWKTIVPTEYRGNVTSSVSIEKSRQGHIFLQPIYVFIILHTFEHIEYDLSYMMLIQKDTENQKVVVNIVPICPPFVPRNCPVRSDESELQWIIHRITKEFFHGQFSISLSSLSG